MDINQWVEYGGVAFGVLYIITMLMEKWISWILGIIAVLLYAYSCYTSQIYGEMTLQFLYVAISFYGIYSWLKPTKQNKTLAISRLTSTDWLISLFIAVLSSLFFYFLLNYFDGQMILADSISNGFAIAATYLAARKKLENWLWWIPINILVMYIMYTKGFQFYLFLYGFYALFAAYGYTQWKKQLQ